MMVRQEAPPDRDSMPDKETPSGDTPCEQFARTFKKMRRNNGITVEEWRDIWDEMHKESRDAGRPCPCGE
jgi:hypothetical protein